VFDDDDDDDDRSVSVQSLHRAPFSADQEKDINTYRAFTVLKSFMDIMVFSGEVCSPWGAEPFRCQQELHPSRVNNGKPLVKASVQTAAASEILAEVMRISDAFVCEHSWLELQRANYSSLYKQKVLDVIAAMKKHITELYPINYRLEILENVYSLLLTTQEDVLSLVGLEMWESGEEGAIGDRSEDKLTTTVDRKTVVDDNHNDECIKVAMSGDYPFPPEGSANKLATSDGDAAASHVRGHCSTASNHSMSSAAIKVGFLANQFILRDVFLTLNELLQDLEAFTGGIEGNAKELVQPKGAVPTKHQHRLLVQVIPCSIEIDEVNQRCSQLMQYISEALWRFQLIAEDWLPKEYGSLPDRSLDDVSCYCFKTVFSKFFP